MLEGMINELKSTAIVEKIAGLDGEEVNLDAPSLKHIKNILRGIITSNDIPLIRRVLMDLHYDKENTAIVGECIRDIVEQSTLELDNELIHSSLVLIPVIMYTEGGSEVEIPTKISPECIEALNETCNKSGVIPDGYKLYFGDLLFDGDSNYFNYKEILDLHKTILMGQQIQATKETGLTIEAPESISLLRFLVGVVIEDGNNPYIFDLQNKLGDWASDHLTHEIDALNFNIENVLKNEMKASSNLHMSVMPIDYYYQSIVNGNHYHGDCILLFLIDELHSHKDVKYKKLDILIHSSQGKIELIAHNASAEVDSSLDVARFSWPILYRDNLHDEANILMSKIKDHGFKVSIIEV